MYGLFTGSYEDARRTLTKTSWFALGRNLPTYIPSKNFAIALLDLAARGGSASAHLTTAPGALSLERVRANVSLIENVGVRRALVTAIDTADNDMRKLIANVEAWYDSAMERATGRYRRASQFFLIAIGLAVAVGFNIDTFEIADFLYRNPTERGVLVARAQVLSAGQSPVALDQLAAAHLPIGWTRTKHPDTPTELLGALLGWLMTGFAVTLGAPFWFDLLNKIVLVRTSLKPSDRPPPTPPAAVAQVNALGTLDAPPLQLMAARADAHEEADGCAALATAPPTDDRDLPPAQGGVA